MAGYLNRHPDFPMYAEAAFKLLRQRLEAAGRPVPVEVELFQADLRSYRMGQSAGHSEEQGDDDAHMDEVVTIQEAMRLAGCSRSTLYRWRDAGLVDTRLEGGRRLISRPSLRAHLGADDA